MQGVARGIKKPNFEKKNFYQFGLAVLPAIEKYSMNIKKKNTFMGENLYYVNIFETIFFHLITIFKTTDLC